MAIASDYAFFVAGSFLGSVVRGATGFGTAIVILSLWGLLALFRIEVPLGGVRRCIHVEASVSLSGSLVLLAATHLRRYAWPWRELIASVFVSTMVGANLGSLLLLHASPRPLELAVGILLFLAALQQSFDGGRLSAIARALRDLLFKFAPAAGAGAALAQAGDDDEDMVHLVDVPGSITGDNSVTYARKTEPPTTDLGVDLLDGVQAPNHPRWVLYVSGLASGLCGGFLSGSTSVGGPATIIMCKILKVHLRRH